ncbi:MAG: dolichol kinase [Methanosarcina sp.]|uniref:dolichol kinase n=1 Tax=Methanosarcina sp. TaxID=2213 RepID=UPI00262BBA77|nr:dolichol kinase [Methanosarcina sp.]MDD3245949.1 dolichol kinase [Methanosarcina sp.]MDD4247913.1 dolichol kinase [Methanosarcina sp.]
METVLQVPWKFIVSDLPVFSVLAVWNLLVLFVLSKKVYEFAIKKGRSINSSIYFSRKAIHFLAGGLTAMLLPFVAHEPILPAAMAFGLALATYVPHKLNRRMYWFQDPENIYDVDFTLSWGLIVFFTWYIDRTFWLGVIPVLFMAYGDGITGIIRNLKYNKRTKAWEGTAGMLVVCIIIGAKMGVAGILAGIVCSFVERIENIDDNITVPAVSLFILVGAYYYFPSFTISLY